MIAPHKNVRRIWQPAFCRGSGTNHLRRAPWRRGERRCRRLQRGEVLASAAEKMFSRNLRIINRLVLSQGITAVKTRRFGFTRAVPGRGWSAGLDTLPLRCSRSAWPRCGCPLGQFVLVITSHRTALVSATMTNVERDG